MSAGIDGVGDGQKLSENSLVVRSASSFFSTLSEEAKELVLTDIFKNMNPNKQDEIMKKLKEAHRFGVTEDDMKFHYVIFNTPYNRILADHNNLRFIHDRTDYYLGNIIEIVYSAWKSKDVDAAGVQTDNVTKYMIDTIELPNNVVTQSEELVDVVQQLCAKILPTGRTAVEGICFRLDNSGVRDHNHVLQKDHSPHGDFLAELRDTMLETVNYYLRQPVGDGEKKIEGDINTVRNLLDDATYYRFEITIGNVQKRVLYLDSQ